MTKKHFEFMAQYIRDLKQDDVAPWENLDNIKQSLAVMAMKTAKQFNSQFDEVRFLKACGL